jgi:4-hydroxybenzoate polyprenyltransferase
MNPDVKKAIKGTALIWLILIAALLYVIGVTYISEILSPWFLLGFTPLLALLTYLFYTLELQEIELNKKRDDLK